MEWESSQIEVVNQQELCHSEDMRTAESFMTPHPKMVSSGDTLQNVTQLFLEQGITTSPVINPLGEILGMLSELTLLKAFMLHMAKLPKSDKVGHHIELLEPVAYVKHDATLAEVIKEMISSPTHRLLVKDAKDKLVGIISPKDLMRTIRGEENPAHDIRKKLFQTEAALRESVKRLESIEKRLDVYEKAFQETPYMMHAVDLEGRIMIANRAEHEILGYREGELIGKTIYDLYAEPMHADAERGLKTIQETGHHHMTYTTLVRKDGSTLRCDIASSSLQNEKGQFISTITVMRPLDSENLLRVLNGIVEDEHGPLARYISQKSNDSKK